MFFALSPAGQVTGNSVSCEFVNFHNCLAELRAVAGRFSGSFMELRVARGQSQTALSEICRFSNGRRALGEPSISFALLDYSLHTTPIRKSFSSLYSFIFLGYSNQYKQIKVSTNKF